MLFKSLKKIIFLSRILLDKKYFYKFCKSQNHNKENIFLKKLSKKIKNKSFIEIGFHYLEFNSVGLIEKGFSGLLVDGGRKLNILIMKIILFMINKKVNVKNFFVTKTNVKYLLKKRKYGCISLDIDGNDYWITKKILENGHFPDIFIVEYNASFLNFPITVPYKENFDRFEMHKSGLYHGASLMAFIKLFKKYNYKLIKTVGGVNAFFINSNFFNKNNLKELSFKQGYKEGFLRNKWSNSNAKHQYNQIKNLPFDKV